MAHLGGRLRDFSQRRSDQRSMTDSTLPIRTETRRCVKIHNFDTPPVFYLCSLMFYQNPQSSQNWQNVSKTNVPKTILSKRICHNAVTVPYAQTKRKAGGSLPGFHSRLSVACMLLSVGIVREPPLGHTVALLEDLFYSPERGESQYPEERLGENRLHEQRTHESRKTEHQKPPPASCAEIIITFDYYGVEKSYDKESRDTEKKSSKIHKK